MVQRRDERHHLLDLGLVSDALDRGVKDGLLHTAVVDVVHHVIKAIDPLIDGPAEAGQHVDRSGIGARVLLQELAGIAEPS